MKITVIIPVYGVEKYIRKCIESIINQTYKNLEIIVVNDGTEDNSMLIVEEYLEDKRIKIINKKNGGQASARNIALKKATGDYIIFVDGDDWIKENLCEVCLKEIKNEDMIIYNYAEYDNETKIIKENIIEKELMENVEKTKKGYLLFEMPYAPWSRMYRKDYIKENKFIFREIIFEDIFWGMESLYLTSKIKVIDESLYFYRTMRVGSMTNIKKTPKRIKDEKKPPDKFQKILKNL